MGACARCGRNMPPQCLYCALCGARMPHALGAGGVLGNRYHVTRQLTVRGQHTLTFLAQDRQSNQYVVLKELRDDLRTTAEARQEFQDEVQTLATMAVAGVPRVRGMVGHEGRQYLVMEFIQGKTLRSLLQKQQRLPIDQAIQVMKAVLGVLEGLHNQFPPMIHMDVTPDNILLAGWDKAFLVDGAYFRALGNPFAHRAPFYTPEYAAPEVVRGQATPASDLYALAVTTLEAITGIPAAGLFDSNTNRHAWQPLPHPALQDTLTRMLEGALSQRLATASQVLQTLEGQAPPAFGAPAQAFQQPQQPQGYGQPAQPGFQQPAQPGFGQPQQGFAPQQAQPPQPGYAQPPQPPGFGQPAPGYGQPAQAPQPNGYQQPPQGFPPQQAQPQQVQGFPQQPQPPQQPPQAAQPPVQPAQPPEPPKPVAPPPPPRRDPPKVVDNIEDVSTEEGLEALMALYEAQNS